MEAACFPEKSADFGVTSKFPRHFDVQSKNLKEG